MNTTLWIVTSVLALAFLAAGLTKATQATDKLASAMPWVEDYSPAAVRLIGLTEIVGAIGLVLPAAIGVAPWLTPLAAAGLAVAMLLAVVVHLRRKEVAPALPAVVLLGLTAAIAVLRFGPYAF